MRSVATSSATNIVAVVCGAVVGVGAARLLGPNDRGLYTAITAWFGVSLVVAEVGQTAAVCFFSARYPEKAQDYLRASRILIIGVGFGVAVAGYLVAPYLTDDPVAVLGYRLVFGIGVPLSLLSGTAMAVLQARNLRSWNLGRLLVPVLLVFFFAALALFDAVRLGTLMYAFVLSLLIHAVLAEVLCRRELGADARTDRLLIRPLVRYGFAQLLSRLPTTTNVYVDKLVLSLAVAPADLGRYAVAATFTSLVVPVATAIGAVALPRIAMLGASETEALELANRSLRLALTTAVIVLVPVAGLAHAYIPALLGPGYSDSITLIYVLAPGGVFLAATQVQGDLLRGRGQPLTVARAQGLASVITILGLAVAIPLFGVVGAAATSTLSYAAAFFLMRRFSAWKQDGQES